MNSKKYVNGVRIKTAEEIDGIRRASRLSAKILHDLGKMVKPGVATSEIDECCYEMTVAAGAIPAPLNYNGFPKSVCVSVNEVVCHGIPGDYILQDGDLVNIDVTSILDGFYGDTNHTFACGEISEDDRKLMQAAWDGLYKGIEQVHPGNRLSNIGFKIQKLVEKRGFSVVRDYTGHGIGLEFHEAPTVLHFGKANKGIKLLPGMVFTIEPMVNAGTWQVTLDKKDGWTVYTRDKKRSAQYEHTLVVTQDGCEILTNLEELWGKAPMDQ
jgi:methionyl aminopeptidase